jgi:hypothetical protein
MLLCANKYNNFVLDYHTIQNILPELFDEIWSIMFE